MKIIAALSGQSLAVLTAFSVMLVPWRAHAKNPGADQSYPADLVQISVADAPPMNVNGLYMMSTWPTFPPLPPPVVYGRRNLGVAGLPLAWSGLPTNCAVYFSPSLGAVLVDDRQAVAQRMIGQASQGGPPAPPGGGDNGTNDWNGDSGGPVIGPPRIYGTNDFWVEPGSLASNLFSAVLHSTTNGAFYLITSMDSLDASNSTWLVEGSLQGATDDATPFTLGVAQRSSLFIRAQPCDDCATTALPLSWQLNYFGVTGLDPNSLDPLGRSLLDDWLNGWDPDTIQFSLFVTNQYVNSTAVPVQLSVLGGSPSYIATLVNDTNTADAHWQPLTSTNLWVPTPTNGAYAIAVGLCGPAINATQTWQCLTVVRDTTPLTLVLTNLAALSGSRPFIDPAGYATRGLSAVTWTLLDANGGASGGKGAVVAKSWNLSDRFHTTNWFQCVDLPLAFGTNQISIQAVDWAGNVAVTNFAYVFNTNGDITPPALTLRWPQDGTLVSGDSFTIQAWMDDDTASVALQCTNADGTVQTVNGLVERGGNVWVEGVPMAVGTNGFSLTATDAAGNVSTTYFSVVQSSVALTIAPLTQEQMQYGYATVMVAVGGSASAVSVNGVAGTSSDGQNWEVDNVPLPPRGTVTLQATAQMGDGSEVQNLVEEDRDPVVFAQVFDYKVHYALDSYISACGGTWTALRDIPVHWVRGQSCTPTFSYSEFNPCSGNTSLHEDAFTWPADNGYLPSLPGQRAYNDYTNGQLWHSFTEVVNPLAVERVDSSTSWGSWPDDYDATWSESSDVEVRLFTGGKALRQGQGLFDLSASLDYADCLDGTVSSWCASTYMGLFLWLDYPPVAVPSQDITLGGLGPLGPDGHLWTVQPDGIEVVITPQVSSCRSASASAASPDVATGTRGGVPSDAKYVLTHSTVCTAAGNTNNARTTIGIGEVVVFDGMPDGTTWSLSGGGTISSTNGPGTVFTASLSPSSSTVTAQVVSAPPIPTPFDVIPPSGIGNISVYTNLGLGATGTNGIGAVTAFKLTIFPTNVSFPNVQFREVVPTWVMTWPNGTNIGGPEQTNSSGKLGCGPMQLKDIVGEGPFPIAWLYNGSSYVDFLFVLTYSYQYLNASSNWIEFATPQTISQYRGSDQKTRETYQGVQGSWQGPWANPPP